MYAESKLLAQHAAQRTAFAIHGVALILDGTHGSGLVDSRT